MGVGPDWSAMLPEFLQTSRLKVWAQRMSGGGRSKPAKKPAAPRTPASPRRAPSAPAAGSSAAPARLPERSSNYRSVRHHRQPAPAAGGAPRAMKPTQRQTINLNRARVSVPRPGGATRSESSPLCPALVCRVPAAPRVLRVARSVLLWSAASGGLLRRHREHGLTPPPVPPSTLVFIARRPAHICGSEGRWSGAATQTSDAIFSASASPFITVTLQRAVFGADADAVHATGQAVLAFNVVNTICNAELRDVG